MTEHERDVCRGLLGLEALMAQEKLRDMGYETVLTEYASKRGVPDADSMRVIRARAVGSNSVEIVVSRFKTTV